MPLLQVVDLDVHYGAIHALRGINISVEEKQIVTLIGANGAGKSTLMMTVFGSPRAHDGSITFAGRDITALPTHEVAKLRIAQSPEGRRIFPRMTVLENLQIGATVTDEAHFAADLERVFALFPRLADRRHQRGGTLSGGEQQMLAIGRALMGNPRVLLMDEPSEGLAPQLVAEVGRTIAQLKAEGQSIVLVEQNIKLTLDLADDVVIINTGRVVFAGAADRIKLDDAIVSQHLGVF